MLAILLVPPPAGARDQAARAAALMEDIRTLSALGDRSTGRVQTFGIVGSGEVAVDDGRAEVGP